MNAKQMSDSYFQGLGLSADKVDAAWKAVREYGNVALRATAGEAEILFTHSSVEDGGDWRSIH
jgi:predicted naringenin-chalcone synthase